MQSTPNPVSKCASLKIWFFEPIDTAFSVQHSNRPNKNLRAWCGLLGGVICLLLQRFLFIQDEQFRFVQFLNFIELPDCASLFSNFISTQFGKLLVWSFGCLLCYLFIPALLIKLVLREKLFDYGLRFSRFQDLIIFVLPGLLFMIPLVYFASTLKHFLFVYPFYDAPLHDFPNQQFFIWEIMYALQFVALEFFFRGFLVHSLIGVMGPWAIPVMVFPYCMIHFQKPFPEAAASIIAGLALGWLGIKVRSIVPGALLHIAVAWGMDLTALWRKGYFI